MGKSTASIVARGVAIVPEGRQLFSTLSVEQNLVTGSLVGAGRRDRAGRMQQVFEYFPRLAERRGQTTGTLSGGEQQMLSIGRALMSAPRLLLVDECQDTDPVQVELVQALCGDQLQHGKLFFVGDYKQSIYRFRGADPNVFRKLQEGTPQPGRLPLTENFRSQPAILHFVNALFCEALSTGGHHGALQDEALKYEPLVPYRPQVASIPSIEFLWANVHDKKKTNTGARDAARKKEAELIAGRIRIMLDSKEQLVAQRHPDGKWKAHHAMRGR